MSDPIERVIYQTAARNTVGQIPSIQATLATVCEVAADAAVKADRYRMAQRMRERIMRHVDDGLSAELSMKVQELILELADQVEQGVTLNFSQDS
jgi:hypothetical protein